MKNKIVMTLSNIGNILTWFSRIATQIVFSPVEYPIKKEISWNDEKDDILKRANWLSNEIIIKPRELLMKTTSLLGEQYGGQWTIYSCSMFVAALSNISKLYPEEKHLCLERMEKVIDIILTPELRHYDTIEWKEDALESLSGNRSHMTYLSILAWAITNFKFTGGHNKYDKVLHDSCEALNRRMHKSKDLNLLSFPKRPIFLPDMFFAIVALQNYSQLYNGEYASTVSKWLENAKNLWTHQNTGLLFATVGGRYRSSVKGSHTGLNCYCLSLIDKDFAKDQYDKMIKVFSKQTTIHGVKVFGIKEYLRSNPKFKFDYNAGPIFHGLSPSGSAFAIGSATFFQDWELRNQLLRTAEIAGCTIEKENTKHYKLSDTVIVGEAVVLAMKTNMM